MKEYIHPNMVIGVMEQVCVLTGSNTYPTVGINHNISNGVHGE